MMKTKKKSAKQSVSSLRERFISGELSIINHLELYHQRIEKNQFTNAFLEILTESARQQASELEKKVKTGAKPGKLAGSIIAIKDNISIRGIKTTCGSRILENYHPPYNATVVEKLLAEDAIIIGKTNLDEFAMGSSTENSAFGVSKNPVDIERVPGGSSGGSAVAIAADLAQIALGSDTGGSIRQPAAFTGVVGLKPTYGRVSRFGLVAFASSLDQIGTLSASVADSALTLEVISGKDPKDSTSSENNDLSFTGYLNRDVSNMRIGISEEFFEEGLNEEIKEQIYKVIDFLKSSGVKIVDVELSHAKYGVSTYYIIATAEASSNLARYDGIKYGYRTANKDDLIETYKHTRNEAFGEEVKRRIMLGTYVLSTGYYDAYYKKAQQIRRLIKNDFDNIFKDIDCLITPTTPTTAFKIGEKTDNPLEMYLSDVYTVNANLAGIPAMSIPVGSDSQKLPIGLQLSGAPFKEGKLIQIGDFIERNFSTDA